MTTEPIPVVSGLRQTAITVNGGPALRAWVSAPGDAGEPRSYVALTELKAITGAQPYLRVTFLGDGAVLSVAGRGRMLELPLVFIERVGLKCYDLHEAAEALTIFEADVREPAAA